MSHQGSPRVSIKDEETEKRTLVRVVEGKLRKCVILASSGCTESSSAAVGAVVQPHYHPDVVMAPVGTDVSPQAAGLGASQGLP